jgi:hypothetical protein
VQAEAVPESSLHWKVEPVFELEKEKLALIALVGLAGPLEIVTTGAVVSIVQVEEALPVLPAGSVAVTVKVCEPAARALYESGEVHVVAVPESSLHWKVEPVFELENANVALVALVGFAGEEEIVTVGGVVSIVHV